MNNCQEFGNSLSSQVQDGGSQITGSNEKLRRSGFRVRHTSGETVCATLDEARLAQQGKPGAKIFLNRRG